MLGGVAYRVVALQFTGSATPPNVYLMSLYVGVLPGLPPRQLWLKAWERG